MPMDGSITASVILTNTGNRHGEEVVQMYIRQQTGSVTRPLMELKGFQKIGLPPGESLEVSFILTPDDLAFFDANNEFVAEPGKFFIFIGGNSQQVEQLEFELLP
jgi:beta-glucosidase